MSYLRGDVIAVPYAYSDLTDGKVRPALVVSSNSYNETQPDVLVAGISSQIGKARIYDYLLRNWSSAGLRYPSLVRGRLLTIEQRLVHRTVGRLTSSDLTGFENKLLPLLISDTSVISYLDSVDLAHLSPQNILALTEKFIRASILLGEHHDPSIDLLQLKALFP